MVANTGDHFRMGRLDQKASDPPDDARHVSENLPGYRSRSVEPWIAHVLEAVHERVFDVTERPGGGGGDSASNHDSILPRSWVLTPPPEAELAEPEVPGRALVGG
jgi:hypothetical protein